MSYRQTLWTAAAALLTLTAAPAGAQHLQRFETTVEGTILFTGNTLGLSNALDDNGQGDQDSIGTFTTTDTASVDNVPAPTGSPIFPGGTTSDWEQNSSSAYLDLPTNKDIDVLYAELLWGGSWNYLSGNVQSDLGTPVTLSFEDGSSIAVTPDGDTDVTIDLCGGNDACTPPGCACSSFDVHYYIRSGVVTDFVAERGPGTYTVSGVPATQDHNVDTLNAAGWTLGVVYQASGLTARNMSLWVGAEWVDENDVVDFTIDGFCAPPAGPVTGQALISAMEGDADRPDDTVQIAGESGVDFAPLSAANNLVDNFFGSQINDSEGVLDTRGTFGDRNHDSAGETNVDAGRQGWDITGVALTDDELDNDQTAATLRATSTGDSYVVTLVGMAVDVNAPSFDLTEAITAEPTSTEVGGTVTFTVVLTNDGTAVAEDVRLSMPLPDGLDLTGFEIDGVSGDIDGNAVATADLESGVGLGDIGLGETVEVTFDVEVVSVPSPPADASFAVRGSIDYEYVSCVGDPAIATEVSADADVVIGVARAGLALSSAPEVLTRGGQATWTVEVENTGTADAQGVTLSVSVPSAVDYAAGSTTLNGGAVPDVTGATAFATVRVIESPSGVAGTVVAGETATVELTVEVPSGAPDSVTWSATLDPDGGGPLAAVTEDLTLDVTGGDEPACGNGRIDGAEECDDGNRNGGDGCSGFCVEEAGWTCIGEPSVCSRDVVDPGAEPVPDAGGSDTGIDMGVDLGDAGADDGSGGASQTGEEACSCSAASPGASWPVLLALLALVAPRRRR